MNSLLQDVRYAVRVHGMTPLSSGIAVIALAIAIACIAASFSLLSDLELKPRSGFKGPGLVTIAQSNGAHITPISLELIQRIAGGTSSLSTITGVSSRQLDWVHDGERTSVGTELVAADYCRVLRPIVRLGRCFDEADHAEAAGLAAIISSRLWKSAFGGRADILGKTIKLTGRPIAVMAVPGAHSDVPSEASTEYRIIGVFAQAVGGTFEDGTDLWIPYERAAPVYIGPAPLFQRIAALRAVADVRDGARPKAVREEIDRRFTSSDPKLGLAPGGRLDVVGGVIADIEAHRVAQRQVLMLFIGSLLLTFVAASNISLFLASRAPRRQRELAIRATLGAPPGRLVRQLVVESAVIVLTASLLGIVISFSLVDVLSHSALVHQVEWHSTSPLDWRVMSLVLFAALLLVVAVSVAPIVGVHRLGIAAASRKVQTSATLTQRIAEAVQVGVACILAGAAIAFIWYLSVLTSIDPGFSADHVYVITTRPPDLARIISMSPDKILIDRQRIRQVIMSIPGTKQVGFGSAVPGKVIPFVARVPRPGSRSGQRIDLLMVSADAEYPEVLGMKLLRGGTLAAAQSGTVLVNETLAQMLWGNDDIVGQLLGRSRMKIVGVIHDAKFGNPSEPVQPMIFTSIAPTSSRDFVIVRSNSSVDELARRLQQKRNEGALPFDIAAVESLGDIWRSTMAADRARTFTAVGTAFMVVVLAVLGLYGTQRYLVQAGRREYAIRNALGAGPRALRRLVLWRGFFLAAPGVLIGAVVSVLVVSWMKGEIISDAVSTIGVEALVLLATLLLIVFGTLGPAFQVSRAAPAPLLREE